MHSPNSIESATWDGTAAIEMARHLLNVQSGEPRGGMVFSVVWGCRKPVCNFFAWGRVINQFSGSTYFRTLEFFSCKLYQAPVSVMLSHNAHTSQRQTFLLFDDRPFKHGLQEDKYRPHAMSTIPINSCTPKVKLVASEFTSNKPMIPIY